MNISSLVGSGFFFVVPSDQWPYAAKSYLYLNTIEHIELNYNQTQELAKLIASLKTLPAKIAGHQFSITHEIPREGGTKVKIVCDGINLEFDTDALLFQLDPAIHFGYLQNLKDLRILKPW